MQQVLQMLSLLLKSLFHLPSCFCFAVRDGQYLVQILSVDFQSDFWPNQFRLLDSNSVEKSFNIKA